MLTSTRDSGEPSYCFKLALAWGFVGIPLIWGVVETLINAIKAFQ